jgi:hypothetical protein
MLRSQEWLRLRSARGRGHQSNLPRCSCWGLQLSVGPRARHPDPWFLGGGGAGCVTALPFQLLLLLGVQSACLVGAKRGCMSVRAIIRYGGC